MDLSLLREATAEDHASVEGTVPLMDPELSLAGYVEVLRRMHGVVAGWESTAAAVAPAWLQEPLRQRSRLALLEGDIRFLGGDAGGSLGPEMPRFANDAELMGAMYVMEGSRLGGQLIARHLERQFRLMSPQGNAYFLGHGERTGATWKEFLGLLEERVPDSRTGDVVRGAKAMFRTFGEWMRGLDCCASAVAHGDARQESAGGD